MHMIRDPQTLHLLLETLQQFVNEALIPRENELAETDDVPADIVSQFRDMGLFGLTLPEAYGGLGLTMEEEVNVAFELGRTSPAFRSYFGTNNGIGSIGILLDGTEAQKQQLPAETGQRRTAQLVLPDRARLRLRRRLAENHRRARRRSLRHQRHQALYHQRTPRRDFHRNGTHQPGDPWLGRNQRVHH